MKAALIVQNCIAGDFEKNLESSINFISKAAQKSADIVVFPSWWESFGLVCIEAMSVGGVVIGSTAGGMSEIIDDGVDGLICDPLNPKDVAEKILHLLRYDDLRKRMGAAARAKVEMNFSLEDVMKKNISFYKSIIKQ